MNGLCARTGLSYVDGPVIGFWIAKTSYGPLNPVARAEANANRSSWARFDTPGSTIYLADDAATAYAETLAMARMSRKFRSAITFAAEFYEISWEEAHRMVREEWIREQVLDDGSYAAGVQFHSKYGSGVCWAYWMRRRDDQLGTDAVSVVEESAIRLDDRDLMRVLARYEIDAR